MDNRSNQKIYIDLIHYPLKTLGPENRIGVWFQGCNILCDDCISPHNFFQTEDKIMEIDDLVKQLLVIDCKRLTISGGEPFNQSDALLEVLSRIKFKFDDILIYSGYRFEYLEKKYSSVLKYVDVLIDGPFKKDLPTNKAYKGSKNQRLFVFNKNLINIYTKFMEIDEKLMQLHKTNKELYILGIPHINDRKNIMDLIK